LGCPALALTLARRTTAWPVAPWRVGKELALVRALGPLAPALVALALLLALPFALLLALAHEAWLHGEGMDAAFLVGRHAAIAERAQHVGHLGLRAADQRHHLRRRAEVSGRQRRGGGLGRLLSFDFGRGKFRLGSHCRFCGSLCCFGGRLGSRGFGR